MSRHVFVFLFAVFVAVSPNPLMQRALSLCPIHGNPQGQLLNLPFELPLQMTQKQVSSPPAATCNPCSTPVNNLANEANQILVNKVLSNPIVQALVDQNRQNLPTNGVPHHIVNNYFIIPSEALLNETRKAEGNRISATPIEQCEPLPSGPKNSRPKFGDRVQQKAQNPYCKNRQGDRRIAANRQQRDYESSDNRPPCRPRVKMYDEERCINDDKKVRREDGRHKCNDLSAKNQDIYDICESDDEEVYRPQIKRSEICNRNGEKESSIRNCIDDREPRNKNRGERRPIHRQKSNISPTGEDIHLSSKRKEISQLLNGELINENNIRDGIQGKMSVSRNSYNSNAALSNEGSNTEATKPRVTRNPTDEAIISDAKRKFPGMSESLIRELLFNVKRQITQQQSQQNQQMYNYPNNYHPMYNNYHQRPPPYWHPNHMHNPYMMPFYNGTNSFPYGPGLHQYRPMRDPNKRKSTKKSKPKNNEDNITNKVENSTNTSALKQNNNMTEIANNKPKEMHLSITEKPKINTNNSENTTKLPKKNAIDESKPKTVNNITPSVRNTHADPRLLKLGEEDELPNIGDNGIFYDDYYPDFTKDNKAYSLGDEFYEYYDEDFHRAERTILPDPERLRHNNVHRNHRKDGTIKLKRPLFVKSTNYQQEGVSDTAEEASEELIYKTPPGLEAPDFQTFKVNGDDSDIMKPRFYDAEDYPIFKNDVPDTTTEEVIAKTSTYSLVKSPAYYVSSTPPANLLKLTKPKSDSIETFFANSKIVKYHTQDDSEETTRTQRSEEIVKDEERVKYATDGDTTIVIAESLGYPEKW